MIGWVVTRRFAGVQYVASYTGYSGGSVGIDIARLGFQPYDGTTHAVVFPTRGAALRWMLRWGRINRRVWPRLSFQDFNIVKINIQVAE